ATPDLHCFPTRRSSDLPKVTAVIRTAPARVRARAASARVAPVVKTSSTRTNAELGTRNAEQACLRSFRVPTSAFRISKAPATFRSEEHTSELQSRRDLV